MCVSRYNFGWIKTTSNSPHLMSLRHWPRIIIGMPLWYEQNLFNNSQVNQHIKHCNTLWVLQCSSSSMAFPCPDGWLSILRMHVKSMVKSYGWNISRHWNCSRLRYPNISSCYWMLIRPSYGIDGSPVFDNVVSSSLYNQEIQLFLSIGGSLWRTL